MLLLCGLGNPGLKYQNSLHNLGFMVLDKIAQDHGLSFKKNRCKSQVAVTDKKSIESKTKTAKAIARFLKFNRTLSLNSVFLAKPCNFMNLSGEAVLCLKRRYGFKNSDIMVICDDFNLDKGVLRLKSRGGCGGHNGLRSIISAIETEDFPRIRIGIGQPQNSATLEDYVLNPIDKREQDEYAQIIKKTVELIYFYLKEGVDKAMSYYNNIKSV
ncbi:MAG: aminoacyl-tRNA hydrolase [Candidatus Omnitrophica bacterium]|nr:aminoacyl-tRNA hydrolase [Candidatus Omnitrophota bacterium]